MGDVTRILQRLRAGGADAVLAREDLYSQVYHQLRRIAALQMRREEANHLLQPTAVVHEAFLKLIRAETIDWRDRAHFLAVASRAIRQVLVDAARAAHAGKRGGRWARMTFVEDLIAARDATLQVLEVERAMEKLATLSPRMAQIVEFRVFAGMTHDEIAECLSVSPRTVAEDWAVGRRYLKRELLEASS